MNVSRPTRRHGLANAGPLLLIAGSLGALGVLLSLAFMLRTDRSIGGNGPNGKLIFRCAAGIQPPVDRIVQDYRRRYPLIDIEVDYQGSGTLLESIRIEHAQNHAHSDLYLAADETYLTKGRQAGLLAEIIPVATQQPVIAVKKGNPKQIKSLMDLLRDDVDFAIADPDGAAIGRATKIIARAEGIWEQVATQRKMMVTKIPELVNAVTIGDAIDAALIWDATVAQVEALDGVEFSSASLGASQIGISVVSTCERPTEALHFARFFASRDQGQPHFIDCHYTPLEADIWNDHPQVKLYAGSMFHAGIEETIRRFERREGITIDRIYNGCGMLVSQMLAGGMPEAYLSCDSSYLDKVADRFRAPVVLSENDIVIVVKKGNPLGIAELAGLAIPTRRVGVCHPTDSALGMLTKRLLRETNLESVYNDPTLMVATGPMLMNAIAVGRQGGLDAAIVYRSNVLSNPDNLDRVEILEIEKVDRRLTRATQPWAIAKETDNPRLLGRLYEALISRASQDAFTAVGFRWLLNPVEP